MVVDGEHDRAASRAAAPSQIVERPQYEPTSTNGAPGHGGRGRDRRGVQRVALVGRHEALRRQGVGRQSSASRAQRGSGTQAAGRGTDAGDGRLAAVQDALDDLVTLLDLEPIEVNIFRGRSPDENRQRVFGGQVAGQALVAAARTVDDPDRLVHSLHAYFLRPGDPTVPILYEVDRIRDGRSFTTRRVVAIQHGQAIFNLQASFHVPEPGPDHQLPMPAGLPDPESLPDFTTRMAPYKDRMGEWYDRPRPIDLRYIDRDPFSRKGNAGRRRSGCGCAPTASCPTIPTLHACIVTYASDMTLLDTTVLPFGLAWDSPGMQMASLDHAMWFHRPFRADEWLLYDQQRPVDRLGRGLAGGAIFTPDGTLAVTVVQEGLARVGRR